MPHSPSDMPITKIKFARAADTCADPTLAHTIYQSFIPQRAFHGLDFGPTCETSDSGNRVLICADRQPKFLAWPTQQNFTVPLFKLSTANGAQVIYRTGTDAQTPPTVSGFTGAPLLVASMLGRTGWVAACSGDSARTRRAATTTWQTCARDMGARGYVLILRGRGVEIEHRDSGVAPVVVP